MAEYRITLDNIRLYGYHGASENERELGQRFEIDVEIIADLSGGCRDRRHEEDGQLREGLQAGRV